MIVREGEAPAPLRRVERFAVPAWQFAPRHREDALQLAQDVEQVMASLHGQLGSRIALERVVRMLRSWPFPTVGDAPIAAAGLVLRADSLSVLVDGRSVPLSPLLRSLLAVLLRAHPRFVTHSELIAGAWGVSPELVGINVLRTTMFRLRARIGRDRIVARWCGLLCDGAYRLRDQEETDALYERALPAGSR